VKLANVTPKTGTVVNARIVREDETELITISKKGQVIKTTLKEISKLGRQTQGVRIMRLDQGDTIASVTCL